MAKPESRFSIQDREMLELSADIHLGLFSLTKIFETTAEFEKCFHQVMYIWEDSVYKNRLFVFVLINGCSDWLIMWPLPNGPGFQLFIYGSV